MTAPSHIAPGPATPVAGTAPGAAGGVSGAVGGAPGAGHPAPGIPSPLASGPPSLAVDGSASGGSALNRSPAIAARVAAVLPWLLILLAHAPLMRTAHRLLTERPQYAFWPLVIVAAGFLFLRKSSESTHYPIAGNRLITVLFLMSSLVLLETGAAIYFRWLAYPSLWLCMIAGIWHVGGLVLMLRVMAPVLLLLAIIPVPGESFTKAMLFLQFLAVAGATYLLELMGFACVSFGTVIEIPGKRLLVAEACSGMNSLLSIVVFAWGYCLVTARSVRFTALILALAAVFMVAANAIRITVCAAVYHASGLDLFAGTAHELISVLLFFAAAALVVSARALLACVRLDRPSRLVGWASTLRFRRDRGLSVPWLVAMAFLFLCVAAWSHFRTRDCWNPNGLSMGALIIPPAGVDEWRILSGDPSDLELKPEAKSVTVWRYSNGTAVAEVSLAYPFAGLHNPSDCYTNAGWAVERKVMTQVAETRGEFVQLSLRRATSVGLAYVAAIAFDGSTQPFTIPASMNADNLVRRRVLRFRFDAHLPVRHEIQTLLVQSSPVTPEQRAALERLFVGVSGALAEEIRRAGEEAEGAP